MGKGGYSRGWFGITPTMAFGTAASVDYGRLRAKDHEPVTERRVYQESAGLDESRRLAVAAENRRETPRNRLQGQMGRVNSRSTFVISRPAGRWHRGEKVSAHGPRLPVGSRGPTVFLVYRSTRVARRIGISANGPVPAAR